MLKGLKKFRIYLAGLAVIFFCVVIPVKLLPTALTISDSEPPISEFYLKYVPNWYWVKEGRDNVITNLELQRELNAKKRKSEMIREEMHHSLRRLSTEGRINYFRNALLTDGKDEDSIQVHFERLQSLVAEEYLYELITASRSLTR